MKLELKLFLANEFTRKLNDTQTQSKREQNHKFNKWIICSVNNYLTVMIPTYGRSVADKRSEDLNA